MSAFDPRQEGWTGWELEELESGLSLRDKPFGVWIMMLDDGMSIVGSGLEKGGCSNGALYGGQLIPHATVVSILLANGYEPTFEPVVITEWDYDDEDILYLVTLNEPLTLQPRLEGGKVVCEADAWGFEYSALPGTAHADAIRSEIALLFDTHGRLPTSEWERGIADMATVEKWMDSSEEATA